MAKVGTFTYFWKEHRYLPLVLEQLERVRDRVTSLVYHCSYPLNWPEEPPAAEFFEHPLVTPWPDRHTNDPNATATLINTCLGQLQSRGAEVALWMDSDFLFTLEDFDRLIDTVCALPPAWWRVEANHYWRTWHTTYARTGFRIGVPITARWIGRWGFPDEPDAKPTIPGVRCHHPSWVLPDEEIERKIKSWFHAPEFATMKYFDKWMDGRADQEQADLQLAPELPHDLQRRLAHHRAYHPAP